jgi:DivIVA domain-containing protein
MAEERLMSITSSLHLAPDDVARHTFASVRRGFDPDEVRAYLESVAVGLRSIADREHQLLEELADAEHRAANPVLDEPTLTTALGTETARVLHSAHEVAAEMVAKAEAEADRLLSEGRAEIEHSRSSTESRLAELTAESEAAAGELLERTNQQIAAGLDSAHREADELMAQARDECRAMVDEAQGLRARVLADLAKRRKVLHAQIEQLRAGRERLAETVQGVRRSIDVIADDLFAAEDNARLAAEAAGREAIAQPDEGTPEELAAALLADEAQASPDLGGVVESEQHDLPDGADPDAVGAGIFDGQAVPDDSGPQPEPEAPHQASGAGAEAPSAETAMPLGEAVPPPGEKVDALFAKLRAASDEPADSEDPPTTETAGKPEKAPKSEKAAKSTKKAATKPAPPAAAVAAKEVTVAADTAAEIVADHEDRDEDGDDPPEERSPFAIQRDGMTDPIVKALARRLKRTLQDSQNELLDSLRSNGSHWSVDLLPDPVEHLDAYATAALPSLEQAAEAGIAFAGTGGAADPPVDAVAGIAHQLADAVVGPLRRRLSDDDGLADAEESVVADHVGSAFREWKGERIERLAGDQVVAAFSLGTIAAVAKDQSAQLEWVAVAGGGDAPCPDCEDNGLNGVLSPGEEFPTGHLHPPAHPGCRCVLVIPAT